MPNVLVIDDERRVRRAMRLVLEEAGHQVAEAEHGDQGLDHVENNPVDLIICDILMPQREGVSTIDELRQRGHRMPIIAVSGGGQTGRANFLDFAQDLGADRTMEKPVQTEELLAAISELLAETTVARR